MVAKRYVTSTSVFDKIRLLLTFRDMFQESYEQSLQWLLTPRTSQLEIMERTREIFGNMLRRFLEVETDLNGNGHNSSHDETPHISEESDAEQ